MALKITTQIGTSKGITSEAYVRIGDYRVSKYKMAVFMIEIFNAQSDADGIVSPTVANEKVAMNAEIGQMLYISLDNFDELQNVSIFEYGYAKLKDKLIGLYGAENVVDC
jgi:hypothetical protein